MEEVLHYSISLDFDIANLEQLKKEFPRDADISFFYWLCYYYLDTETHRDKALSELRKLSKNPKETHVKRTIQQIEEGKI